MSEGYKNKLTKNKLSIGILFGGRSGEHEVSLASARSILNAIDKEKYEILPIGITLNGQWLIGEGVLDKIADNKTTDLTRVLLSPLPGDNYLYALSTNQNLTSLVPVQEIDVFFPVLHGTFGEDGTLQGFLEMADMAYVGAGVLGASVGMDKALFKDVMRTHNIPVVESLTFSRTQIETDQTSVMDMVQKKLSYPVFIKPANMGSSVGITKCQNQSDLYEGLLEAAKFDRRVLVEHAVNAREIEVSVLGNDIPKASVPGEIIPKQDFYSYSAKYEDDNTDLLIPAPLPEKISKHIQKLAVQAYKAIDCAGMARVDFLLDKDTQYIYLNEVNTIPGFTRISMYPKLWEASGIDYPDLIDRLIDLALERKSERDRTERKYRSEA